MNFKSLDLLTLLISLFILNGCKDPSTIGLDINDDLAVNSELYIDSTITTKLIKEDSVISNFQLYNVMGYFKDPAFGTTEAYLSAALTLGSSSSLKFDSSALLDSAVLVLPFAGFYGDSLNTQFTVNVKELNENLYQPGGMPTIYNTKSFAVKPLLIGEKTIKANIKDSIIIQDIRTGKPDTVKKVIPQLRIKLNDAYATNVFLKADSSKFKNNIAFTNYFKGLQVSLNKLSTTNNGGLFLFNTSTTNAARLDLFYTSKKGDKTDTLQKSFLIEGNQGFSTSKIHWNYAGAPVESEFTKSNSDKLFLKSLAGTKTKISFPNLKNIKTLGKKVIVNRAELVIQVDNLSQAPYLSLPQLNIYKLDIANRPQLVADENPSDARYIGAGYIGGFLNTNKKIYTFNLTGYIQDIIDEKNQDYGTFISAFNSFDNKNYTSRIQRTIAGGGLGNNKMRLKIFYTIHN